MQGNYLFSLQFREIINHNHPAFKLGFVLLSESSVQCFSLALTNLEMQILLPEERRGECLQLQYLNIMEWKP